MLSPRSMRPCTLTLYCMPPTIASRRVACMQHRHALSATLAVCAARADSPSCTPPCLPVTLTARAQADSSSCAPLCQYVNLMACARADSSSWPQGTPASRGRRGAPAVPPAPLYRLYRLPSRAAPVCCWSRGHRWRAAGGKGSRGSTLERRGPVTGRGGDLFVFIPGENLYIWGDVAGMLYCN